jgi:peptide/nickel transport system ATP-binding protein
MAPLLAVENLTVRFPTYTGLVHAVNGISFTIDTHEIFGLIGESGSGKSVTARAILRVLPAAQIAGHIRFQGIDMLEAREPEMRRIRGRRIAMISQDPLSSLNPVFTIGEQLIDALIWSRFLAENGDHARQTGVPSRSGRRRLRADARRWAIELLRRVHLPSPEAFLSKYPHELSGGMRQRVLIAMAMTSGPDLLIADEPTTALDVSIQAQFLNLLRELVDTEGISVLYISHDLSVVAQLCDRVAVMYGGHLMEVATAAALFRHPRHPYTRTLLAALTLDEASRALAVRGEAPDLRHPPAGCAFAPRCPIAVSSCFDRRPPLLEPAPAHVVLCDRTEHYDESLQPEPA